MLIHDENQPRSMWRMGIVEEIIHSADDNQIRGAVVRSNTGSRIKRPVNKLYPIEIVRYNDKDKIENQNESFWKRWLKEYAVYLREIQSSNKKFATTYTTS